MKKSSLLNCKTVSNKISFLKPFVSNRKASFTLAEVFSPHSAGSRKVAFTLAEVLITLGIIGIVAAMTLPNLIAEYKKHVYVAQLQKAVSILEQGFQKMKADDGVDKLSETQIWASMGSSNVYILTLNNPFFESLQKYFMVTRAKDKIKKEYKNLNISENIVSSQGYPLLFNDGFIIYSYEFYQNPSKESYEECNIINNFGGSMCSFVGVIYIDINGNKNPNTWGRDIYIFYISDEGKLYPLYGSDYALYMSQKSLDTNSYYWRNNAFLCGVSGEAAPTSKIEGSGCGARIIENGWKMDY